MHRALRQGSMVSHNLLWRWLWLWLPSITVAVLVLLLALALDAATLSGIARTAQAQVIVAPDKSDELEQRAFLVGQTLLDEVQASRHANDLIDINVYTFTLPTQFVIGLILDPCRHRAYDCCSDRFSDPAYVSPNAPGSETLTLLDESGAPLGISASRVGDRPTQFDPDCYIDSDDQRVYRLLKTLTPTGITERKVYGDSSRCIARLKALVPMEDMVMPPCWDRNASIDATQSCVAVDGREKPHCVSVGYTQTGYIVQCFGTAFALDNHCGTFLEVHERGSDQILSQTRLLGEYPSGFRTTTLPLFFRGDPRRTICQGEYEVWWVLRTRYNFIVQKRKPFYVTSPQCDFDFATNTYKNYHTVE